MSKIGFDISALDPNFKAHANRGIGRYVRELKKYFDKSSPPGLTIDYFDHNSAIQSNLAKSSLKLFPLGKTTIKQHLYLPRSSKLRGYDLLHFPAHMDVPSSGMGRYVVTVLDLIPLKFKELYCKGPCDFRYRMARALEIKGIRNASHIIAISESTAKDLIEILGIGAERISTIPLGVDGRFLSFDSKDLGFRNRILAKLGIPSSRPIVLYVGGIDPRKNTTALLVGFKTLTEKFSKESERPLLVIAGQIKKDKHFPAFAAAIKDNGLSKDVVMTGYVADEDLPALYAASNVFFFPSLYEGFGLPALEAMAVGTPVVSSNTSSLPEVVGKGGVLLSPNDHPGFAQELFSIISSREKSLELSVYGRKRAALFTWEKVGAKTLQVYQDILRG